MTTPPSELPTESEPRIRTTPPPPPALTFRIDAMKLVDAYARARRAKKAPRP
jgi:hypothetical protein